MEEKGKNRLYLLLLGMMLLPLAETILRQVKEWPLVGVNEEIKKPALTPSTWLAGTFQDSLNRYAGQTVGFRTWLSRFNNQIAFTFYGKSRANGVTVLKDGYLTDKSHTFAWTGEDVNAGNEALLRERVKKLKWLEENWQRKGIHLLTVVVSGKGYYFPEQIPGHPPEGEKTLYKILLEEAAANELQVIDLGKWMRANKEKSGIPYYNRSGIHWTYAGSVVAADSLLSVIERITEKDLPDLVIRDWEFTGAPRFREETDVFNGMNILQGPPRETYAYPDFALTGPASDLNLLTIGDSYFFSIFTSGITGKAFARSLFVFYYKTLHNNNGSPEQPRTAVNMLKEMENSDLILLFLADSNLPQMGWGFIEEAYELYHNPAIRKEAVLKFEAGIRKDPVWMKMVAEKALAKNIAVDSMIRLDAIHLWNTARLREVIP